jgi:putative flippase GtrA
MNAMRSLAPAAPETARRLGAFVVVGAIGMAVQIAAFALLNHAGLHYALASALAVEVAVLHNFAWHERWTWADRPVSRTRERLARLLGFHLANGLVSIGGTLLFTIAFVESAGLTPIAANVAAVGVTGILNFVASDRLVFAGRHRHDTAASTDRDDPCLPRTGSGHVEVPSPCSSSR